MLARKTCPGMRKAAALLSLLLAVMVLSACGGSDDGGNGGGGLSGLVSADGSSTVGPFASAAAQRFKQAEPDVNVTVGISGTGGGFERFCAGETDLSNASRAIEEEERTACADKGIQFTEFHVANDGIALVANMENDWADCLTVDQLKKIWEPASKVKSWREIDPSFPDEALKLFGPGTDSGTFDFFTEQIVGEEGASRSDYSASENDNVTVRGVAGETGGLGYFGLSYFEENRSQLKDLGVDGGSGCVKPTRETVQDGTYKPLARPLYIYAKNASLERPEVQAYLRYIVDNGTEIADAAKFVPLTPEQKQKAEQALDQATS
jgi:phosphate transport system substrate-binding protein